MSGGLEILKCQESDVAKMLAAAVHLGTTNSEITMQQYMYKRRSDGVHIINLKKTWEKLMLAARAIAAVENPEDVFVVSSRSYGQRAVLKFARYIGATAIAGRFTPGAFTNQIQAAFREPRLLIVADPRVDHQPVKEGSYANIPIVAFCNSDSPTRYIDVVIPCNNKAIHPIGLMWWFLAREVLHLRGSISRTLGWDVMPDLFFYRDPEEAEKEEQARQEALMQANAAAAAAVVAANAAANNQLKADDEWGNDHQVTDWANEPAPGMMPGPAAAAAAAQASPAAAKYQVADEWATGSGAEVQSDWAAADTSASANQLTQQWGGVSTTWH